MLKRLRDSRNQSQLSGIIGSSVLGLNNEKLGTIDDVVYDPETSSVGYAVVESGGWLSSDKFLVPADRLSRYEDRDDVYYLPVTRDAIGKLPAFDSNILDSEDRFRPFEARYRNYWASVPSTKTRSRIAEFDRPTVETSAHTGRSASRTDANISVYGVYRDQDKVREAVESLKAEGFTDEDISVLFPEQDNTQRFAVEHNTKAPEGAATGGATGVIAGGVIGWLAGVGTLAIPGIGPLLAAGPIVAALAGAGAGGAIGGVAGGLIGMGLPELEAKRYEAEVKQGRILIAVRCSDMRFTQSVRKILERTGAKDLFVTGEPKAA